MPDLNTISPHPHNTNTDSAHRASSQQMAPLPAPGSPSLNVLPSNQSAVNASAPSSALPSPRFQAPSMGDNTGVGSGPGPVRHPRPLTAAELHLELEKEQEAVVNRLTRELSMLRAAQNASVVSNASSTSASTPGTEPGPSTDPAHTNLPYHPHHYPPRHHRTSSASNTSARSSAANAGSMSTTSLAGISSPAPVRPTAAAATAAQPLSRQNSSASRASRTSSPSPSPYRFSYYWQAPTGNFGSTHIQHHHNQQGGATITTPTTGAAITDPAWFGPGPSNYFNARVPPPHTLTANNAPLRTPSGAAAAVGAATTSSASTPAVPTPASTTTSELSPGILPGTSRFEETALRRAELEEIRRENEALRQRVRELERMVSQAKAGGGSTASNVGGAEAGAAVEPVEGAQMRQVVEGNIARHRAVSTVSSVSGSVGPVAVGVPDEEVNVGESAASAGIGRGRGRGRE